MRYGWCRRCCGGIWVCNLVLPPPDLASLRAMYRRAPTLIEHQQLACDALGLPSGCLSMSIGSRTSLKKARIPMAHICMTDVNREAVDMVSSARTPWKRTATKEYE